MTFDNLFFIERVDSCNQAVQTFENGYGVSVLYGKYAYSSYRFTNETFDVHKKHDYTYEVAILKDFDLVDDVLGYQTPEDINKIIEIYKNIKK